MLYAITRAHKERERGGRVSRVELSRRGREAERRSHLAHMRGA